jgi:hypothetical protein
VAVLGLESTPGFEFGFDFQDSQTELPKWLHHSAVFREQLGVSKVYKPWTSRRDIVTASSVRSPRIMDIIDLAGGAHKIKNKSLTDLELQSSFFCDVGQAVQRRPWSHGHMSCLCQGSVVYSYEGDGFLTVRDHLRLQGHPKDFKQGSLTDSQLRSLAGEGFCAPCIATCLYAAFVLPEAPWW